MSRIYGKDENDKPLLLRLECDANNCDATIKPHPEIASSGWVSMGVGELTWDYCDDHNDYTLRR